MELIPYSQQAIQQIETIEEAQDSYQKLKALVSYFNSSNDYEQAFSIAVGMIECAAKGGELIQEMQENGELAVRKNVKSQAVTSKLSDFNITRNDSSRWQKIASVPLEKREDYYSKCRGKRDYPTLTGTLKLAKKLSKQETIEIPQTHIVSTNEIKQGQWWQLGDHLLYCGDTSSQEFIDRLPQVDFAFADPPYNAGVDDWDNDFNWQHDYLINKAKVVAVTPGIISIFDFAKITQMPYVWSFSCWIDNGMTRGAMGYGNWIYGALFSRNSIYRQAQDMIRVSIKTNDNRLEYKGRKPPGLLQKLIELYADDTIIDPFLGTGTTLLVAEQMNKICYGGEIQPELCENIISVWEEMTGKHANSV